MTLAISSYASLAGLVDDDATLNLAWTSDERAYLAVDPAVVAAEELRRELEDDAPYVTRYFVRDPYGDAVLRPVVAAFFAQPEGALRVTCGAGVDSLLHDLASLARSGPAYALGDVYPDFPHWVERSGAACRCLPLPVDAAEVGAQLRAAGASVVLLERPSLPSSELGLADVHELCGAVGSATLVVVDESYATYRAPAFSAVALVPETPNLVVLRGVSKAYGMGGLRLGLCVASPAATERVRALVTPLLASSLSLRIVHALLACGDVAEPLRRRVRAVRPAFDEALKCALLDGAFQAGADMPYAFAAFDDFAAQQRLERAGVIGKRQPFWSPPGSIRTRYRMSIPLLPERMERLQAALARLGSTP